MNRILSSILCSVVLTACPGEEPDEVADAGGANGGGDAGMPADSGTIEGPTVAAIAASVCAKQAACCPRNAETEQNCRESIERVFGPVFRLSGIAIDEAAYNRCLMRIDQMSCDEAANYAGRPPVGLVCEKFYRGTAPLEAACGGETIAERFYDDDRCESGACAAMKCAPRAELNGNCMEAPCVDGLICYQGTCRQGEGLNADCSTSGLCTEPYECFGQPLTCQQPTEIPVGEVCEDGTLCVLGEGQCFCPLGQEGCLRGSCGNRSRCLN